MIARLGGGLLKVSGTAWNLVGTNATIRGFGVLTNEFFERDSDEERDADQDR